MSKAIMALHATFAVTCIILITMLSARAEVDWANEHHVELWAEAIYE